MKTSALFLFFTAGSSYAFQPAPASRVVTSRASVEMHETKVCCADAASVLAFASVVLDQLPLTATALVVTFHCIY